MTRRSRMGGRLLVPTVLIAVLGISTAVRAHHDPSGCSATGVSIEIRVFRSDGVTGVVGSVSECESITYQVVLKKSSAAACAFQGGTLTLTLPNGTPVVVSDDVPCIGGTVAPCSILVNDLTSGLIPYTVQQANVVGGFVTATATYAGGVAFDNEADTPGVSAMTPKKTPVASCSDDNLCTTDRCDPTIAGSAACFHVQDKCDDHDACTANVCEPATGRCTFPPAVTCNDNDLCTQDTCDPATGECAFTPKVVCDDHDACTKNLCDPATGTCEFPPTDLVCNDGNPCTQEACDPATGTCKQTGGIDCDDGDLCTTDTCNPAAGCTHTNVVCVDDDLCTDDACLPAKGCTFTDSSARCDDGDPCTMDRCDPQQGCLYTPITGPQCKPLHHFQCYEAKPFAFPGISGVNVEDRYGNATLSLRTPHPFCLPSDKRGEDPAAAMAPEHLLGYADSSEPVRVTSQTVTNQFGTVKLDLVGRTYLLVPAAKSLTGPTPPLADPQTDHFQCYLVKRSLGTPRFEPQRNVAAVDQLGFHTVDLVRPRYLCVPANKNGEDPTAPSHTRSLLCYKARHHERIATTQAFTNDQFGPLQLTLTRRLEFCVPSRIK